MFPISGGPGGPNNGIVIPCRKLLQEGIVLRKLRALDNFLDVAHQLVNGSGQLDTEAETFLVCDQNGRHSKETQILFDDFGAQRSRFLTCFIARLQKNITLLMEGPVSNFQRNPRHMKQRRPVLRREPYELLERQLGAPRGIVIVVSLRIPHGVDNKHF